MSMFHVYVEGATDPSPDALARLAEIMSSRYGLPIADVTARLAKGRFRVKANVDRETADIYVRDLGAVGAKVVIEPAAKPSSPSIPVPSRTATPPSGVAPVPSRTATPPSGLRAATAPAAARSVTNPPFASGLAAAFENTTSPSQDLGVLGGDSGSFALSSVDGGTVESVPAAAFAPPPPAAAPPPPRQSVPKMAAQPAPSDMFAPPDAAEADERVELASDEIAHRTRKVEEAKKRASTPPPIAAPGVATPVLQRRLATSPAQNAPVTVLAPRGRLGPLSEPRNRMAAGVFVAILLGFLPTHMIASYREHDAFQKIDSKYLADASGAPDPGSWAALDEPALRDKKSAQHGIMVTSFFLWALFAGGIGYVWFKRVPWDKLDATG